MFDAAPRSKRNFTWNPAWAIRFESLWSLANKFALLNVVSVADVTEMMGASAEGSQMAPRTRKVDRLSDQQIGQFLGLPSERVSEGRPELLFVKKDRPWLFPKDTLRYCPTCLAAGYHSSLHQPHCVKLCPVHGTLIESSCPSCSTPLPLSITGHARAEPYSCPACGHKLWKPYIVGPHGSVRNVLILKDRGERELLALHDWFVKACSAIVCRSDVPRWLEISGAHLESSFGADILNQAPTHWGSALNVKVPRALGNSGARGRQQAKARLAPRSTCGRSGPSSQSSQELPLQPIEEPEPGCWDSPISPAQATGLYKAVRRYIRHSLLRGHRVCADTVEHSMWREPDGSEHHPVCAWAFAYLYWRRLWEQRLHLSTPRVVMRVDRAVGYMVSADGLPIELSRWIGSRGLVLELLMSFEECALLARKMEAHHEYSWDPHLFHGRYYPYWTVVREPGGSYLWSDSTPKLRPSRHLRRYSGWRAHWLQTKTQAFALKYDT